MQMHLRPLILSLILISCSVVTSAVASQGQHKKADTDAKNVANVANAGPVVEDWDPKIGSINSVIDLMRCQSSFAS